MGRRIGPDGFAQPSPAEGTRSPFSQRQSRTRAPIMKRVGAFLAPALLSLVLSFAVVSCGAAQNAPVDTKKIDSNAKTTGDKPQKMFVEALELVYNKDKNQVISTAKFVLTNQVIPAAKYTEMQQYMDNVAKAQNKKLVIRKKA